MLPKLHRVTKALDFLHVRQKGTSQATSLFILSWVKNNKTITRFGFIASKKVGGAVQRNRATRLLREAAKANLPNLQAGFDIVLIARSALIGKKANEITNELTRIIQMTRLTNPLILPIKE